MKKTALLAVFLLFALSVSSHAYAQDFSTGTAIGVPVIDKVQNGDIISSNPKGYKLSTSAYDSQIFGIVSLNPAVYLRDTSAPNDIPVISTGDVLIRVSSQNGSIKPGDFITSSSIPGVGQKATDNGYILGRAQQGYTNSDTKRTGLILVTLQPHYAQVTNDITHSAFSALTLGINEAINSPLGVIRYFVAGMITLLSFYFGFRFFARASNRGVEAIGRNPLAKQAILFSVFVNTIITISIMFFGVAISYLILVL